ncbi:MAG: hypothetical protein ACE5JZ_00295 [Kiloniellales bacterium]
MNHSFRLLVTMAFVAGLMPSEAWAYLDPGTGGMLLQLLLGGVAGALVVIKLYWSRLREVTARIMRGHQDKPEDGRAEPD